MGASPRPAQGWASPAPEGPKAGGLQFQFHIPHPEALDRVAWGCPRRGFARWFRSRPATPPAAPVPGNGAGSRSDATSTSNFRCTKHLGATQECRSGTGAENSGAKSAFSKCGLQVVRRSQTSSDHICEHRASPSADTARGCEFTLRGSADPTSDQKG